MNMVRCPYGHIYDSEQYRECPICMQNNSAAKSYPYMSGGQRPQSCQGSVSGTRVVNGPTPVAQVPYSQEGYHYPDSCNQQPLPVNGPYPASGASQQIFEQSGFHNNNQVQLLKSPRAGNTQIFYSKSFSSEPIGGWLVCVMGNDKGKAFSVSTGKDTIGRSDTKKYKINISDDKISRSNPIGTISYVSDQHRFYFVSDPLGNLTPYVNGVPILTQIILKDYDEIRIGTTVMLFRAFCSEKMNWNIIEGR